jgi:hypothetical protein
MSRLLLTLTALILVFGAGFGASMLLCRNASRVALTELIALSWLLGTAVVSLSLWLLAILLRGVWLQIGVTIISLALALGGVALFRKERVQMPRSLSWIEYALAAFLLLELAVICLVTFQHTLGWDGLLIWELKARYAYLNGGALPAAYFSDATRAYSHPDYPLYLSMIEMWLYLWIGDPDQFYVKLIFPVFYAAGVVLLAHAGASLSRKRWSGLLVANLFLFVPFLTRAAGGIVLGYADVPLSIFYVAAFYFLSVFTLENSKTSLAIFVAIGAILPWLKREGVILWFVLTCCGAWMIWRRRGILPALVSFLPGVCVLASWQTYLSAMHASISRDFSPISLSLFLSNFHRLGPVLQGLIKEATNISHWSFLWYLTPVAILSCAVRHRSQRLTLLVICSIAPIILYCGTYLFSAWPDYLHHVRSSLPRLLLHVVPVSILSIALALAPRQPISANEGRP